MKKASSLTIATILLVIASFIFMKYKPAREWITEVDYRYLNGSLFTILGKDYGGLSSDIELYHRKLVEADYGWLPVGNVLVAHSLGVGGVDANTLNAFERSLSHGFKYFEVDLILSENDIVCAPRGLKTGQNQLCNLGILIQLAKQHEIWFILDVKSDFNEAYLRITPELEATGIGRRFIPQIYKFKQIENLNLSVFSGPIFTGYRLNQSGPFMVETAVQLGVPVITLPPNKLQDLQNGRNVRVLTHNVKTLNSYDRYSALGVSGFYLRQPFFLNIQQ